MNEKPKGKKGAIFPNYRSNLRSYSWDVRREKKTVQRFEIKKQGKIKRNIEIKFKMHRNEGSIKRRDS